MTSERHARIKELFRKAAQVPEANRPALLERECGGDNELIKEVESLLAYHNTETILVRTPAQETVIAAKQETLVGGGTNARDFSGATAEIIARLIKNPFRRNLTIAVLVLLMAVLGAWMHRGMRSSLREILATKLQTILDAEAMALRLWMHEKQSDAEVWARQQDLRELVEELAVLSRTDKSPREKILSSKPLAELREELESLTHEEGTAGYAVIDRSGYVLAAAQDDLVGIRLKPSGLAVLDPVFSGRSLLTKPFPEGSFSPNQEIRFDVPVVWVSAPVRDEANDVVAAFGFGLRADHQFTGILEIARMGRSGETYAFDREGRLLSESRFNEQLQSWGMIADAPAARSIFQVYVRDPGGDLSTGYPLPEDPSARPLTELANAAISSRTNADPSAQKGVLVEPYRDYRGEKVIGAWMWLADYDFGIATELDSSEAYAPLRYPIIAFWIRFGFLVAAVGGLMIAASRIVALKQQLGAIMQLGQYALSKKIGEGGMGTVYLAKHALLRRPTAVKLLRTDQMTEDGLLRFEREVQLASQLTHPNTIEIYDYGCTDEGVFYYAMEYLPGLSLAELIEREGPVAPGRVVCILKQVCRSLQEAHARGLVHRDIKPPNIMLCERGGEFDFVKVLDFGLVREIESTEASRISSTFQLAGTPLYMAPERLKEPGKLDTRSDLYSVGAVGYNLLTAKPVFESKTNLHLYSQILNDRPLAPSSFIKGEIPSELEVLVLRCLEKDPNDRPQDVAEILENLESLPGIRPWTQADACAWWQERELPQNVNAAN